MNAITEELKELTFIHLQDAVFCANCELIANQTYEGACPACGSKALMSVSRLLGGTVGDASVSAEPEAPIGSGQICQSAAKHRGARSLHLSLFFSRHASRN